MIKSMPRKNISYSRLLRQFLMIYMMRPVWASTGSSGARDRLQTVDDEGSVVAQKAFIRKRK